MLRFMDKHSIDFGHKGKSSKKASSLGLPLSNNYKVSDRIVCKIVEVRPKSMTTKEKIMKKTIGPDEYNVFLADFSKRNTGRRARFESFSGRGVAEEDEEAVFENISISGDVITVKRTVLTSLSASPITDEVTGVHGVSVQYDTDNSENTLEFMDTNGDMTVLHFESLVDGDS